MTARKITLILLVLFSASSLYGQGQRIRGTLTYDGRARSYLMYIPSSYDPTQPMPLVFNFHGLPGTADQQEALTNMNEVAEHEGFLVVYPNALGRDWRNSNDHNIDFIETLLDTLAADYSVDSQSVYATGGSQGAIMTFVMAVALPDRFAAVAPVSGPRLVSGESNRLPTFLPNTPARPFPLLYMHGTADTAVPYDGGRSSAVDSFVFPPVAQVLAEWVDSNGGTSLEQTATITGIDVTDGAAVSLFQCGDCGSYMSASGDELLAEVVHMRINGGGHVWPASNSLVASSEIWNFFSRHELSKAVPEPPTLGILLWLITILASARRRVAHTQRRKSD